MGNNPYFGIIIRSQFTTMCVVFVLDHNGRRCTIIKTKGIIILVGGVDKTPGFVLKNGTSDGIFAKYLLIYIHQIHLFLD